MGARTPHIKTGVKMCPDIYTWVWTPYIATSGESAYYSVSGGYTAHEIMFKCSYWGGDTGQNSKTWGLAGLLALSVITVPILDPSCKLKLERFKLISKMELSVAKNVSIFSY